MEKNEAFRKQVLSRLYGLPDPTETSKEDCDDVNPAEKDAALDGEKEGSDDAKAAEEKEKDFSVKTDQKESGGESDSKDKDLVKNDHHNNNGDSSAIAFNSSSSSSSSSKVNTSYTPPTTTTSHLYSVLMAPLDGRSPYRDYHSAISDSDSSPKKRMKMDVTTPVKVKPESEEPLETKPSSNLNSSVGVDLSKNQKRKLKKKKRKHLLNKIEVQRAKDFIYSSENEQYSVEKLRTMIEDVTEFLDAIWDVYCSEARLKSVSVEQDGYQAAAVLKCLSASGEGSWADLQLLSRAKSVLVLRSKDLAASTISRVENELGYEADIRNFIVRMLKFWMEEIVTKG